MFVSISAVDHVAAPITTEALGDEIASLAADISAATGRWLSLIAEFDERLGWAEAGAVSCAAWVSWRCGVAQGTAREHVRVARRLEELPLIRCALERGELSYSKARALTRIGGIQDEAHLLELSRHADAGQLDRIVAAFRGVTREEADQRHTARGLELFPDVNGTLHIRGRLPAELAAVFTNALAAAVDQLRPDDPAQTGADGVRTPIEALRADALVLLARLAASPLARTASGPLASTVGACPAPVTDAQAEGHSAEPDELCRLAPASAEITIHVDAAMLTRPDLDSEPGSQRAGALTPDDAPRCELQAGPSLAAETVRRICCDAGVVPIVRDDDGAVLSVGRRTRSIPPSIRRALAVRDEGCCFPGCGRTRWLQAHHVKHWAHGGDTALDNLALLCGHHHQLVHEGGWQLVLGEQGQACEALSPTARRVTPVPEPPAPIHERPRGVADGVEPDALYPRSAGALWDLGMAVDAVMEWTAAA